MSNRNLTVCLDEETARWVRVEAARRDTSVSKLVRELLRERMKRERSYDAARQRWLAGPVWPLKRGGAYPPRDELRR